MPPDSTGAAILPAPGAGMVAARGAPAPAAPRPARGATTAGGAPTGGNRRPSAPHTRPSPSRSARGRHGPGRLRIALAAATAALAVVVLAGPRSGSADPAVERGLAIAREADRRDSGFVDSTVTLRMVLRNAAGDTSTRALFLETLEVQAEGEGDKTLIVFKHPPDVEGTALLTHGRVAQPDDQWLYLPALKRVKRIASVTKSGPFMGSEFAYEDLASQEVAKYRYRHLRDEPCGALSCFVVERVPLDPHSGYTRQVVWIDASEYRSHKVEYYDRKDALLKTLTLSDFRRYQGRFWRALGLSMENHQTGKSTQLVLEDYRFGLGLPESRFTPGVLPRIR